MAISAKQKKNIFTIIDNVIQVHKNWNVRISTTLLNKWLQYVLTDHRPPLYRGKEVRLKYATQVKARPPTFVIMTNYPEKISDSYIRYLKNSLVEKFKLGGVNPRIILKKAGNPFSKRAGVKTSKK